MVATRVMPDTREEERLPGRNDLLVDAIPGTVREALESHRFGVQYEPVVELKSGAPCGFEALARFEARDGSPLDTTGVFSTLHTDPALFADVELSLKRLQLERSPGSVLFLNVDPEGYAACGALGLPLLELLAGFRSGVVVEIIENMGRSDAGCIRTLIRELAHSGLDVALDDLFAPNALVSLDSLVRVQYLKFDRSTLRASMDLRHRALVEALLGLARRLGVRTVLEGVETQTDLAYAALLGVDLVQGHLFREDFVNVLPRHRA